MNHWSKFKIISQNLFLMAPFTKIAKNGSAPSNKGAARAVDK